MKKSTIKRHKRQVGKIAMRNEKNPACQVMRKYKLFRASIEPQIDLLRQSDKILDTIGI